MGDDLNGQLVAHYRAIGKPAHGHGGDGLQSPDEAELVAAMAFGQAAIDGGSWIEFYVKVIYRRVGAVRTSPARARTS